LKFENVSFIKTIIPGHLLNIEGDYWKKLREKLTPTFTSGKMRQMMPTIVDVGTKLEAFIQKTIQENPEPEIKDILARYTTDIIGKLEKIKSFLIIVTQQTFTGSCAFGIECNSMEDKTAKFLEMGLKVFQQPRNSFVKQLIAVTYPDFARKIGVKIVREDVAEFFMKIVKDVVEYRETNKDYVKRNDFMDLLLQLKNDGTLADESSADGKKLGKLTVEEIAAQGKVT
jgi:cytochrome P450 family 6